MVMKEQIEELKKDLGELNNQINSVINEMRCELSSYDPQVKIQLTSAVFWGRMPKERNGQPDWDLISHEFDSINQKWDEPKRLVDCSQTKRSLFVSAMGAALNSKGSIGAMVFDTLNAEIRTRKADLKALKDEHYNRR